MPKSPRNDRLRSALRANLQRRKQVDKTRKNADHETNDSLENDTKNTSQSLDRQS